MKLSDRDKQILAAIELQAGVPIKDIQEQTGLREHAIRYTIRKLQDAGIISSKRPIVDLNKLGFSHYNMLFSLTSESHRNKKNFLDFLAGSELTTWMFELGGDFHYGVSITVKHINRVGEFLQEIAAKFGNIFFEKLFSQQLSYIYFGRRYLTPHKLKSKPIRLQLEEELEQLDQQDQQIVRAMTSTEYHTLTELADHLAIPLATLERRKSRLEERGIIRGYFYWIQAAELGVHSYTILIYIKGISPDFKENLIRFAKKEPHVVYFIECMGNWDFELGIEVSGIKEVTSITQKLYDQFSEDLKTLKVIPILNHVKFKGYTPGEHKGPVEQY